jgi:hypothetical protein
MIFLNVTNYEIMNDSYMKKENFNKETINILNDINSNKSHDEINYNFIK